MTYFLQIAHPNDVLSDQWQSIELLHHFSELEDHLAAPTFTTYKGLVVRLIRNDEYAYVGIHDGNQFVNVGRSTCCMRSYPSSIQATRNYISAWRMADDPQHMLPTVVRCLSRERVIRLAIKCLEFPQETSFIDDTVKIVNQANLEEIKNHEVRLQGWIDDIRYNELNTPLRLQYAIYGSHALCYMITHDLQWIGGVFDATRDILGYGSLPSLCDLLRREVPFYDLAISL